MWLLGTVKDAAIVWVVQCILESLFTEKMEAWSREVDLDGGVKNLKSAMLFGYSVVDAARGRRLQNEGLSRSLRDLKQLLYDAENVMNELDYYRLQREIEEGNGDGSAAGTHPMGNRASSSTWYSVAWNAAKQMVDLALPNRRKRKREDDTLLALESKHAVSQRINKIANQLRTAGDDVHRVLQLEISRTKVHWETMGLVGTVVDAAIGWLVQSILGNLFTRQMEAWTREVGLAEDVENLKMEMRSVEMVLAAAAGRRIVNKPLSRSLDDLKELLYDAEDVMDELDYYRLLQQIEEGKGYRNAASQLVRSWASHDRKRKRVEEEPTHSTMLPLEKKHDMSKSIDGIQNRLRIIRNSVQFFFSQRSNPHCVVKPEYEEHVNKPGSDQESWSKVGSSSQTLAGSVAYK